MTWDGYACWGQSKKGTDVELDCPQYIPHAMPSGENHQNTSLNLQPIHFARTRINRGFTYNSSAS